MKSIVIYNSQTGFSEQYAKWIAQALKAECISLKEAQKFDFSSYNAIIFGSWACAGKIQKVDWFKKMASHWRDKKLALFCTGAAPEPSPEIQKALDDFHGESLEGIGCFYFPGGLNYAKMGAFSRLAMKGLLKALKAKKNKTKEDELMIKMISSSYTLAKKSYIEPLVQFLLK